MSKLFFELPDQDEYPDYYEEVSDTELFVPWSLITICRHFARSPHIQSKQITDY